jgi:YegS/Rv2252/BmrU family lipid kinase
VERHILYLVNPISGRGNKQSLQQIVEERTSAAGIKYSIYPSVAGGNYTSLYNVIEKEGVTDVVIAGGDGTVSGAVQALKHYPLSFGILPCGSGNGLSLGAGIPKNIAAALDVVFKNNPVATDAFLINDHFACMLCGLGFDAQVAHDFANDPNRGLNTYIKKTVAHFFSAQAYPFTLTSGDDALETEAMFISIANSNQFGNNFTIAPKASLRDGLLDVVIVAKQSKLSMLVQTIRQVCGFNQLYQTQIGASKAAVLYFQTDTLQIQNPKRAPLHVDGDPAITSEGFTVKVLKGCFRLLCP